MASQQSSSSSSFQGIENPEALQLLMNFLRQSAAGGTPDYLAQRAVRTGATQDLQRLTRDYTNQAAFHDAADLMKLNLQQSYEKQMPAIQKAVQGAGTSASSMQGLLSSKLATDAAMNAGALGAEQAKAYAGAMANMQGTIENFTRIDNSNQNNILNALKEFGVARQSSSSSSSTSPDSVGGGSSSSSGGSTGGSAPRTTTTGGGWSNGAATISGGWGVTPSVGGSGGSISMTPSSPDSGFYYDDWGTGSTAGGDMAGGGFTSTISGQDQAAYDNMYWGDPLEYDSYDFQGSYNPYDDAGY